MIKKIILLMAFLNFMTWPASGEDAVPHDAAVKEIVIFNFYPGSEEKEYGYYSNIIPMTLAKIIGAAEGFKIRHIRETLGFPLKRGDDKAGNRLEGMNLIDKKIRELPELSKSRSLAYVITGSYTVEENTLNIHAYIYNVKGKVIAEVNKKSAEAGVLLQETADDLVSKIKGQVALMEEDNKKKFAPSPYLPMYRGINFISFGFDAGEIFLIKDWKKLYDNTQFINSYIMFHLSKPLALSLNADYFGAHNPNENMGRTNFTAWSGIADIHFFLRFSEFMYISLSGGGGMTRSEIEKMPDTGSGPDQDNAVMKRSFDPVVKFGLSMNIEIRPVFFRFGSFYKRILYSDKPLELYTIYAGVGFRI